MCYSRDEMTPKEVLQKIEKQREDAGIAFLGNIYLEVPEYREVIKALEKQIPKKPEITTHSYRQENTEELGVYQLTHCPSCWRNKNIRYFESLIDNGTAFCRRCGQALDWSDCKKEDKSDV